MDPNLFEQAKIQQERIRELIPDSLSVEYQLGPEPSQFSSVQEWAAARRRAFDVSDKISDLWLSTLSFDDGSWFTLLAHPDAWPELRPIIAEEPFERLMSKGFAAVKSLSPFSVIPIQIRHIRSLDCADVLQLCSCVVEIVRKHGIRLVRNHPLIDDMLVSSQFPEITPSEAQELFRKTHDLKLPPFWPSLVTKICSTAEGVDVRQLLLQQTPNTYELSTWRNPEIIDVIRGQHWLLDRLADRLRDMVNSKYRFDPEQLRKGLGVFVEKRSEFPVEIPLAAMEALLRVDEIVATPLSDNDWQIANN